MSAALLVSLAALLVGPLAYDVLKRSPRTLSLLDGLVFVAIPALILLHVVPWAVELGSWIPLLALGAGAAVPVAVEHGLPRAGRRTHLTAVALGLSGLLVHTALDGAALAPSPGGRAGGALTLAIVLHRLPVGLVVWWLVRPRAGQRVAAVGIGALLAATLVGYWMAGQVVGSLEASAVGLYQAFVGGTLIHVVFHDHVGVMRETGGGRSTRAEGLGAVLALALLAGYLVLHSRAAAHRELLLLERSLLGLALLAAPALLVAYAGLGVVGSRGGATLRRWLAPERPLALDAALLSIPLLGLPLTVARVGAAAAGATLARIVGGGSDPAAPGVAGQRPEPSAPSVRAALLDAVDRSGPWVLLSLGVATVLLALTDPGTLSGLPDVVSVVFMAAAGLALYLSPVAATAVAAALLAAGLSPGAALAFLITVPAAGRCFPCADGDRHDHGHGPGPVASVAITALAVAVGLVVDLAAPLLTPSREALTADPGSPVRVFSLLVVSSLFAHSLLRRGVRRFAGELRLGLGGHEGHSDHGHGDHPHHGHEGHPDAVDGLRR